MATKKKPASVRFAESNQTLWDWWEAQGSPSRSLEMLIMQCVKLHGLTDIASVAMSQWIDGVQPSAAPVPKRGRPPGKSDRAVRENPKPDSVQEYEEPEEFDGWKSAGKKPDQSDEKQTVTHQGWEDVGKPDAKTEQKPEPEPEFESVEEEPVSRPARRKREHKQETEEDGSEHSKGLDVVNNVFG